MTLQCPANFLHFLQSENIGSPDGDPITIKLLPESNIGSASINFGSQRSSVKKHPKVSLALCVGSSNMHLTL